MTSRDSTDDLPGRLRVKAGIISMGERISYGSETAMMREAADEIERLRARVDKLEAELYDAVCEGAGERR